MSSVETKLKQTSKTNANMAFRSLPLTCWFNHCLFVLLLFACVREREGGSAHGKGRAKMLKHVPPACVCVA